MHKQTPGCYKVKAMAAFVDGKGLLLNLGQLPQFLFPPFESWAPLLQRRSSWQGGKVALTEDYQWQIVPDFHQSVDDEWDDDSPNIAQGGADHHPEVPGSTAKGSRQHHSTADGRAGITVLTLARGMQLSRPQNAKIVCKGLVLHW